MDNEIDHEMQTKIEQMIAFKRPKDRKQLLNNPPKKETQLKGSKDNNPNLAISKEYRKGGEFGPPTNSTSGHGDFKLNTF